MLVVRLAANGVDNCVSVGRAKYIYSRVAGGQVLPVRCPHRGGPLHLATLDKAKDRLVCPWHGRSSAIVDAADSPIPAVRVGARVTAVVPAADDIACDVSHVPVSADLAWTADSDEDE